MEPSRLGRGLDSLIASTAEAPQANQVIDIPVASIRFNPQQPRRHIDEDGLNELAASIERHGILQPVVVRRLGQDFELIAGERRLRASSRAGRASVPAMIVEADGATSLELALIENVQREALSPLDEAEAYQRLLETTSLTHQQLGERLGRSRAVITNALRLLDLPADVQAMIDAGELSAGQARAVLALKEPGKIGSLARQAVREGMSVRELERNARLGRKTTPIKDKNKVKRHQKDRHYEDELAAVFDARVVIIRHAKGGEITFKFHSNDDGDRLLHLLVTRPRLERPDSHSP